MLPINGQTAGPNNGLKFFVDNFFPNLILFFKIFFPQFFKKVFILRATPGTSAS